MENTDGAGKKYLDAIIIDSKLSQETPFTPNQNVANGLPSMVIKSIPPNSIVKGQIPPKFEVNESITEQGLIRKMWSDGNGNYQNVE